LVEQNKQFGPIVESWLQTNPADLVASEMGRMETLIVPVRNADVKLVAEFERFFTTQVAQLVSIDRAAFDKAIEIRAAHPSIRTPDAIHLAAAVVSNCDVFLTNDPILKRYPGVRVEMI
jgi:predicted nucleic acid-binding protein